MKKGIYSQTIYLDNLTEELTLVIIDGKLHYYTDGFEEDYIPLPEITKKLKES